MSLPPLARHSWLNHIRSLRRRAPRRARVLPQVAADIQPPTTIGRAEPQPSPGWRAVRAAGHTQGCERFLRPSFRDEVVFFDTRPKDRRAPGDRGAGQEHEPGAPTSKPQRAIPAAVKRATGLSHPPDLGENKKVALR
jgi:hypothetical protein